MRKKIKPYEIHHETPFSGVFRTPLRYVLLPYGYSYGDVPKNARRGDYIEFLNGDIAEIISVCVVDIHTKVAEMLCQMRYGTDLKGAFDNWVERAYILGAKRTAISDESCLMVWHTERLQDIP